MMIVVAFSYRSLMMMIGGDGGETRSCSLVVVADGSNLSSFGFAGSFYHLVKSSSSWDVGLSLSCSLC